MFNIQTLAELKTAVETGKGEDLSALADLAAWAYQNIDDLNEGRIADAWVSLLTDNFRQFDMKDDRRVAAQRFDQIRSDAENASNRCFFLLGLTMGQDPATFVSLANDAKKETE